MGRRRNLDDIIKPLTTQEKAPEKKDDAE